MIKNLLVNGFQKWRKLRIDFDRVTCLIGPSRGGKSAILRCLRWLMLNDRRGDGFIHRGADRAFAKLTLDDGREIIRVKGSGENFYKLDGRKIKFNAGEAGKVPPSIAELLCVSNLNFQTQHAPPFWFSSTAGQVARDLNAVIDLGVIDRVLSDATKEVNRLRNERDLRQHDLNDADGEAKELEWVGDLDADLQDLEKLQEEVESLTKEEVGLTRLLKEADRFRREAEEEIPNVSSLVTLQEEVAALTLQEKKLSEVVRRVEDGRRELQAAESSLSKAQEELRRAAAGRCPVCKGVWNP